MSDSHHLLDSEIQSFLDGDLGERAAHAARAHLAACPRCTLRLEAQARLFAAIESWEEVPPKHNLVPRVLSALQPSATPVGLRWAAVVQAGAALLILILAWPILAGFAQGARLPSMWPLASGEVEVWLAQMSELAASMEALSLDMIDSALSPLAFGSSHPATESMVAMLRDTPFDSGIDLTTLEKPAQIAREIRDKYQKYATEYAEVSGDVLIHKIPGGMIANMVANLEEAGKPELMDQALKEIPSVAEDLGYPPLLTPLSQVVGVQATLNVITGERYKIVTKETRDYPLGF